MRNSQGSSFTGKVAAISGGSSGIGRALSLELAKRGAHVTIFDLQEDLGQQTVTQIRDAGGSADFVGLDVSNYDLFSRAIAEIDQKHGRLDYMFNNAGISMVGGVNAFASEDWKRLLDINIGGVINGCRAAYEVMYRQKFGHIINTASIAGLTPHPGSVFYAATKHAVVGLSKSLNVEAARHNVIVSVLCPGVVDTPLIQGGGKFGKSLVDIPQERLHEVWKKLNPMPVRKFATLALNDVLKKKAIIIHPAKWKAFWLLDRLSPSLSMGIARRVYESKLKEMGLP